MVRIFVAGTSPGLKLSSAAEPRDKLLVVDHTIAIDVRGGEQAVGVPASEAGIEALQHPQQLLRGNNTIAIRIPVHEYGLQLAYVTGAVAVEARSGPDQAGGGEGRVARMAGGWEGWW